MHEVDIEAEIEKELDKLQHYIAELGQQLRIAFSDYIKSEGCSCCRDLDEHQDAARRIGELLCFNKYEDSDDYNFYDIPERINDVGMEENDEKAKA